MIDFRYHLISIVAVLLALAIGIVMGSGFLGGPLLERLQTEIEEIGGRNRDLQSEVVDLKSNEDAVNELAPHVIGGILAGQQIVLFQFEGSDGAIGDGIQSIVEQADGTIASTITLSTKFALAGRAEREELATLLESPAKDAAALRADAALLIGSRAAAASEQFQVRAAADQRLQELLDRLAADGYLDVARGGEGDPVPSSGRFLILGGSADEAPYDVAGLARSLALTLAQRGTPVVAAESFESSWGLVSTIRDDPRARDLVWTDDQADEPAGRIAVALELDRADQRPARHYGRDPSASDGMIPEPESTG